MHRRSPGGLSTFVMNSSSVGADNEKTVQIHYHASHYASPFS